MKSSKSTRVLAALTAPLLITLAGATPASADGFSLDLRAGIEHDSNIVVSETDIDTGRGDWSAELDVSAEYEFKFNKRGIFEVGYDFRQSLHKELDAFDVQTHGLKAGVRHRWGNIKLGIKYNYFDSSLGGNAFMALHRISPYVTYYLGKAILVRATYTYEDKNIKTSIARDATVNSFGGDAYVLIDGSRTYISFGYKMKLVEAVGDQFDYDANIARASFTTRVPLLGKTSKLRLSAQYEKRNYDNITPSIGAIRDDKKLTLRTSLWVPIGDTVYVLASYKYRDLESNFPSADYSESVASLQFGLKF